MRIVPSIAAAVTVAAGLFAGCTEPAGNVLPDLADPQDAMFTRMHAGDVYVIVPGTGSYDYLTSIVDPMPDAVPVADIRKLPEMYDDVFEEAIATQRRAGLSTEQIEAGDVHVMIWGAGFANKTAFTYVSYEGVRLRVDILGGESVCAHGLITDNLLNYSADSAKTDANDLYTRIQGWLAAHPSDATEPRNVILGAHSWGGAVAEYETLEEATLVAAHGPWKDGDRVAAHAMTIAMGVPHLILGYTFQGAGLRDLDSGVDLYEIDRPDDPVPQVNPSGNTLGHNYPILFGDVYQGLYGITTEELSCAGVPGPCGPRED
ncbi:MAG TPA: hypothetical protein VGM90_20600 [Kofleriaceae bacterium]|jgi:hypothetical protein